MATPAPHRKVSHSSSLGSGSQRSTQRTTAMTTASGMSASTVGARIPTSPSEMARKLANIPNTEMMTRITSRAPTLVEMRWALFRPANGAPW